MEYHAEAIGLLEYALRQLAVAIDHSLIVHVPTTSSPKVIEAEDQSSLMDRINTLLPSGIAFLVRRFLGRALLEWMRPSSSDDVFLHALNVHTLLFRHFTISCQVCFIYRSCIHSCIHPCLLCMKHS